MEQKNEEKMTSPLILDSLEIDNFRAFRHLLIERLSRVNLIVGKNNIGKSCLLEALRLYASYGSPETMKQILTARNEFANEDDENSMEAVRYLFHDLQNMEMLRKNLIKIGSVYETEKLVVHGNWVDEGIVVPMLSVLTDKYGGIGKPLWEAFWEVLWEGDKQEITNHIKDNIAFIPLELEHIKKSLNRNTVIMGTTFSEKNRIIINSFEEFAPSHIEKLRTPFVSDKGMNKEQVSQLWNKVYLTDSEDDVINALRIIEPKIKSIGFVDDRQKKNERVPMARLADSTTPVFLSSLGEGMSRMLGLALAMVNAESGFLLIDKIDNGIHYSAQADLWRIISETARKMNLQVFATTHSWDCIEAFQEVSQERKEDDMMLVSLRNKQGEPGNIVGVLFDREELEIVTRENIEVR